MFLKRAEELKTIIRKVNKDAIVIVTLYLCPYCIVT